MIPLELACRRSAGPGTDMVDEHGADSRPQTEPTLRKAAAPREVRLEDLLHGDRELLIRHGEEVYHLRVTRNGRLLLTK